MSWLMSENELHLDTISAQIWDIQHSLTFNIYYNVYKEVSFLEAPAPCLSAPADRTCFPNSYLENFKVNSVQRDDVQGIHLLNDIMSAQIILHVILHAFQANFSHIGGMGVDGCCFVWVCVAYSVQK